MTRTTDVGHIKLLFECMLEWTGDMIRLFYEYESKLITISKRFEVGWK